MYNIKSVVITALVVINVYAQEPINISRFLYDSVVAADCVQGKAPEDVCAQFITNIELMVSEGEKLQAEVYQTLNRDDLGITDPALILKARARMLRSAIEKTAEELRSRYDDRRIFAYLHETQSKFSYQALFDERKKVRNLYFKEFLKSMASSDTDTYYTVQHILREHLGFYSAPQSLKIVQNAFFESARKHHANKRDI